MSFDFGIDALLADPQRLRELRGRRVALVAHPASVTANCRHSIDALVASKVNVLRAFGPQHGMRGDKQDNMVESPDYVDRHHQMPVLSLYGAHRAPTREMLEDIDVVLFDLQDIGCRIYTYISTLKYFVDVCSDTGTELWVLDRPNPAGRPIDGLYLEAGEESFVGVDRLPTRHGLTTGELAQWFARDLAFKPTVIPMQDYAPLAAPGFGWPVAERVWVNPSPNASSVNMTRHFPGTVLLEGTTLSEGRGTTIPLEVIGAPDFPADDIMSALPEEYHSDILLRSCAFETTFHKHQGELSHGIQLHSGHPQYGHEHYRPYRLIAAMLKILRQLRPDYALWRHHEYEYEFDRVPIDVINGGPWLREWVDDDKRGFDELDTALIAAAERWQQERAPYLLYPA